LLGPFGAHERLPGRRRFASRAFGHGAATGIAGFGSSTSGFVFTGTGFGIARLDGNSKRHDYEGQDKFFHWGSYTRFLEQFKCFLRFLASSPFLAIFGAFLSGTKMIG